MTLLEKLGITAGPWMLGNNALTGVCSVMQSHRASGRAIANLTGYDTNPDARLIAQAPAMLEMIIKTAYLLEYIGELERPIGMLDEVTAIIQNATDKTWEEIKEMMEVE